MSATHELLGPRRRKRRAGTQADAALAASEARFRSLTELSSDWYWEQDADLRFTFVSEGFFQKSSIRREDVLGKHHWDFAAGSPVRSSWEGHRAVPEARLPFRDFEFERIEADGTKHYQTASGDPVFDPEGRFSGYRGTGRDVTERRRTLAALEESEDRYRDLVEHSQDLICTHQLDGRIRSVNPWAAQALGYEVAELLNMNIREVLAPETRSEFADYLARIEKDGVASGLMLVQSRTGEKRVWQYTNSLRTGGVAAPIVRGMAHDVTEQLRVEAKLGQFAEKLAAAEAQLRAFMDHSSVAMLIKDREGRYRHVNAQFLRNFGLTADQVLGRTSEEVFGRPQAEAFSSHDARVRATRAPLVGEVDSLWVDGVH